MNAKPQFRPQAVNRHIDTDLAGGLLRSAPRGMMAIWTLLVLVVIAAGVFASVYRVDVHTEGRGIIRPSGGAIVVRATRAGQVQRVEAHEGASFGPVNVAIVLQNEEGMVLVRVPEDGVISEVMVDVGAHVQPGDPLFSIIPTDALLLGYVAMPEKDRAAFVLGQPVRLRVDAFPYQEQGIGEGQVHRVSPDLVPNKWAQQFRAAGIDPTGMVLVEVLLDKAPPRTKDPFQPGMLFTCEVVVRRQRIASLVFRPLANVLGD